jgi:hypothetical protein
MSSAKLRTPRGAHLRSQSNSTIATTRTRSRLTYDEEKEENLVNKKKHYILFSGLIFHY